jgi:phage recombination protein Bet
MSTAAAQPQQQSLIVKMATQYGLEPNKFYGTLEKTILPGGKPASPEQVAAFLVVANHYGLNPFVKEIYAFPSQGGGITPIVSIDGWLSLINRQPQLDGIEFKDHLDETGNLTAVTARIYRKDRQYATEVTEYMKECKRNTSTWTQWPARMLRHKAAIQAARYAFGFSGIADPDEAERIAESETNGNGVTIGAKTKARAASLKEKLAPEPAPVAVEAEPDFVDAEPIFESTADIIDSIESPEQFADTFTEVTKPTIEDEEAAAIAGEAEQTPDIDKQESQSADLKAYARELYSDAKKNDRDTMKKMNEFLGQRLVKDLEGDDLTAFCDTFSA